MKRNFADKAVWRRVLSADFAIAVLIATFVWWPAALAIYVGRQFWRGRRLLFSFSGRMGRKSFWRNVYLFSFWAVIGGAVVVGAVQAALPENDAQTTHSLWLAALLIPFVIVPVALCAVATGMRRLHDCDRPGAWLLALYGIPIGGIAIYLAPAVPDSARTLVFLLVILPGIVCACLVLGCQRGTAGPNRFGADPATG
jgi:uncharacterized membrane protein YhaH (DUF805 family)